MFKCPKGESCFNHVEMLKRCLKILNSGSCTQSALEVLVFIILGEKHVAHGFAGERVRWTRGGVQVKRINKGC